MKKILNSRYRNAYTTTGAKVADSSPEGVYKTYEEYLWLEKNGPPPSTNPEETKAYWISQGSTESDANYMAGYTDEFGNTTSLAKPTTKTNYTVIYLALGITGLLIAAILLFKPNKVQTPQI